VAKLRAVILRRWYVLTATLLLGCIAGFVSASVGAERGVTFYDAEQIVVANRMAGNPANVKQDALKVPRGAVAKRAAAILGQPDDAAALARKVSAGADVESNSIKFVVSDVEPERASEVVQAYVAAFLEVVNAELKSEDERQLEQLRERVDDAEAALESFDAENGYIVRPGVVLPSTPSIDALVAERQRLVQELDASKQQLDSTSLRTPDRLPYSTLGPQRPSVAATQLIEVPDSPIFRAGLLGAIGLLLGVGLVIVIERVNQRIDTRDELAALIEVPIIAEIGKIPARQRSSDEAGKVSLDGVWSEHYRRVRSAIQFVQADATARSEGQTLGLQDSTRPSAAVIAGHRSLSGVEPRIFLFASALPGEGKSTSVALTAKALAETGTDTLVINADFRRPMVEKYLGAASSPSLADRAELSVDRLAVPDIVQAVDGEEHLWVAASGKPTHEVGGRLAAAKEVAAEAAASGGTVLIDTSPLRVSNDPIDLLSSVDEVILVVRAGRTTVKSIEDTMGLLEMHHAPILGVVLIGTLATREMYAYYQSYYRQAEANDAGDPPGGSPDASGEAEDSTDVDEHQRDHQSVYVREGLTQLPDPAPFRAQPPTHIPPPFGQPGSA
jgi:Mrp family chromosome partitioning ATPase